MVVNLTAWDVGCREFGGGAMAGCLSTKAERAAREAIAAALSLLRV